MRFRDHYLFLVLTLCVAFGKAHAEEAPTSYQAQLHLKVPLRDGVNLNATVYRPYPTKEPLPVIFMLTPYPGAATHSTGAYFASHGYIYADIHERGRGDSEGDYDPFVHDAQDGYDIVEWLAKQPWCNGKVAMFGGSYPGGDQWLVAMMHPPHLSTIVPTASARPGTDFPMTNHVMWTYDMIWLTYTGGKTLNTDLFNNHVFWTDTARRLYLDKAAFADLDAYVGTRSDLFQTYLKHPDLDAYWKARRGPKDLIAGIEIPILEITGAQDGDQAGALSFHADQNPSRIGTDKNFLVMGPWDHAGTRDPKPDVDGEHYGPASLIDILLLHRQWYDYTMKNGPKPAFLQKSFIYYVAGPKAECWKSADSITRVSSKSLTFFLDAEGGAKSPYHSGSLRPTSAEAKGGEWVSNPSDLSNATETDAQPGALLHGDGLIFHSDPFTAETEIDGQMELKLWLSIDAPDTDLKASLYLVSPDGKSHFLSETNVRARYRYSDEHPEPVHENQPEEYHFSPAQWFAIRAAKGSQMRLIISSLNDPSYEKNWNSMKPVAEQTGKDARVAHIRLLQTPEHASTLTLPLGDPTAACRNSAGLVGSLQ